MSGLGNYGRYAVPTPEEEKASIAHNVAGFAGMFWDSTGHLVIRTTGEAEAESIVSAVAEAEGALRFRGVREAMLENRVRLRMDAAYDFASLLGWQELLEPVLFGGGVASYGIDERRNAIRIRTSAPEAAVRIRAAAFARQIPIVALVIETGGLPQRTATLRGTFRPIPGGVDVNGCSLGANVVTDIGPGFITASHCTGTLWHLDSTVFYQPASGSDVGWEASDPEPMIGCGSQYGCRYTDAAFIRYAADSLPEHGYVARTTGYGSITIDIWHPRFIIADEDGWLLEGATVDKMDRATGWTWGEVFEDCWHFPQWGGPNGPGLLCQIGAEMANNAGDSGGPVFTWPASGDDVTLHGIVVGRVEENEYVYSIISNWTYVALEIGYDAGSVTAIAF